MTTGPAREFYRPLIGRPEASTLTVRDLLRRVQEGRVRIPSFQRPLRWRRDDVVKLFDSLWRGYPAGSLLFWKKAAEADPDLRVGSARLPAPAHAEAWWVVDGQQRITALAACLLDLDHGRDPRWRIWFDTEVPGFGGEPLPGRAHASVPGPALGDTRRLMTWLRDHDLEEPAWKMVDDAHARILDYTFPIYVVTTDEEQALRAAFARMNSAGARMRADEVFNALLGTGSSGTETIDLEHLQAACDTDLFGAPPRADVLKAVLAMSGLDPSRRLQDLAAGEVATLVSGDDAEAALRTTVAFLQDECEIPQFRLLPYPVVFSILARWFHLFPESEPWQMEELRRWLWRGAASGVHQRAEVSRMRLQVDAIREDGSERSLRRLMEEVPPSSRAPWALKAFNSKSAHSRIEMLAMLEFDPEQADGQRLDLLGEDRLAREVFASPDWKGLDDADLRRAKSGANRVLLGGVHTGLAPVLRTLSPEALRTHLIDEVAFHALTRRDIPDFLRRREELLREAVDAFLARRADWDGPVLRPVSAYLDDDEIPF
jgi:hypothetical protein